jgi:hypothetical protein
MRLNVSLEKANTAVEGHDVATSAESVVKNRVFRLGSHVDLDGRLSWAAQRSGRVQPLSGYVVKEDDRAYLLDTGVAAHRAAVVQQFSGLLPQDFPLTAYLTRADYQCLGNLEALNDIHRFDELAFGHRSPFSAFGDVSRNLKSVRQTLLAPRVGVYTPLASSDDLVVFPAIIRVLGTNWVYSKSRRVLFSSDWFFHTDLPKNARTSIISDPAADETTYDSAVEHVLRKYYWLPSAKTAPLRAWLKKIFEELDIETIAPTFGCVLKGREVVEAHYELAMEMLLKLERKNG